MPAEASLLFGRGLRAGVDRREQKKQAAAHEADLMRQLRVSQGIAETREDRQRSRNLQAAADAYDHANNKVDADSCARPLPVWHCLNTSV